MKNPAFRYAVVVIGTLLAVASAVLAEAPNLNSPTGTHGVIMIDKLGAHVRFFDAAAERELANIESGANPHDFAISPDHKTAYVTIYGDGIYGNNPHPGHTIEIFDLASRQRTGTIDVSPYQAPHGIQIDADGTLYVTCDLSRTLLVIDPKKRNIEATIDTGGTGHWIALVAAAHKIYVANKNDKPFISVIDLKSRKMIGTIAAPHGTQGIVASPDGTRVLAVDFEDPALLVISTATDAVVDRIPIQGLAKTALFKVFFSADGTRVLTCSADNQVNILAAANLHAPQTIVTVGKAPMGFGFASDGKTVLVANHGDGTVSVIDVRTGAVERMFHAGTGIETLAYY